MRRPIYKLTGFSVIVFLVLAVSVDALNAGESSVTPGQAIYMIKQLIPQVQTIGLMWNRSMENTDDLLPKIERAAITTGVRVVIEDIEGISDIPEKFRDLKDNRHVQVLWIIDESSPFNASVAKDYLVKNAIVNGIALFAPNADWVSEGACTSLSYDGSTLRLCVNKKTISALGLNVPDKYLQHTDFFAAK